MMCVYRFESSVWLLLLFVVVSLLIKHDYNNNNYDETATTTTTRMIMAAHAWSFPSQLPNKGTIKKATKEALLQWFQNSELVAKLHEKHVSSSQVQHMMKENQWLIEADDDLKVKFATGFWGNLVSEMMASEQELLGEWKIQKIVEAASSGGMVDNNTTVYNSTTAAGIPFDIDAGHQELLRVLHYNNTNDDGVGMTLFSFVDCPWCLLAKKMLQDEYNLTNGDGKLQIIELEHLNHKGKQLRASIALSTGRTSMPACFIGGKSIGGFTDGFQSMTTTTAAAAGNMEIDPSLDLRYFGATGMKDMHENGELKSLISKHCNI